MNVMFGFFVLWLIAAIVMFGLNNSLFVMIAFLVTTYFLTRIVLIITGLLKGPILRNFEKYGDDEDFFYPLPTLFFWLGIFIIVTSFWLSTVIRIHFPGEVIGALILICSYITQRFSTYFRTHPNELMVHPRWLYDLLGRTSRLERRRIAYMWLRLPLKSRIFLNSSDRAFLQWADLIILSTLM